MSEPTASPGKKITCALCRGSGFQSGTLRCLACRGKGAVEFAGTVVPCAACRGKGRALNSSILPCLRCRGVGVVETSPAGRDLTDGPRERIRVMAKRLRWTREETKKRVNEIKKKTEAMKPAAKKVEQEVEWLKKFGNIVKESWESLWKG